MIGTLGGVVALLYRAQVAALKEQQALQVQISADQIAWLVKYAAERDSAANYWRDKYLELDARLDKRIEALAAATALIKATPRATRPGPGQERQEQGRRDA